MATTPIASRRTALLRGALLLLVALLACIAALRPLLFTTSTLLGPPARIRRIYPPPQPMPPTGYRIPTIYANHATVSIDSSTAVNNSPPCIPASHVTPPGLTSAAANSSTTPSHRLPVNGSPPCKEPDENLAAAVLGAPGAQGQQQPATPHVPHAPHAPWEVSQTDASPSPAQAAAASGLSGGQAQWQQQQQPAVPHTPHAPHALWQTSQTAALPSPAQAVAVPGPLGEPQDAAQEQLQPAVLDVLRQTSGTEAQSGPAQAEAAAGPLEGLPQDAAHEQLQRAVPHALQREMPHALWQTSPTDAPPSPAKAAEKASELSGDPQDAAQTLEQLQPALPHSLWPTSHTDAPSSPAQAEEAAPGPLESQDAEHEQLQAEVPHALWQTYRSAALPAPARAAVDSWRRLNPALNVHLHTDADADAFVAETAAAAEPAVLQLYRSFPLGVMRADFWRYAVLLAYGGVYSDVDVACGTAVRQWLPPRDGGAAGLALQERYDGLTWSSCAVVVGLENDVHFCQWTFAATAAHPLMAAVVDTIVHRARGGIDTSSEHFVHLHTGPGTWTDTIRTFFNFSAGSSARDMFNAVYSDTAVYRRVVQQYKVCLMGPSFFLTLNVQHLYGSQTFQHGREGWVSWIEERDRLTRAGLAAAAG